MPIPSSEVAAPRTSLREQVFARLRAAIVDGTLEPGERLHDAELCRWLGVSRTPVREAIARLDLAGLVVVKPGSSTVVSPLDHRAARDAAEVAAAMHELATRTATPHLTAEHLDVMTTANAALERALHGDDVDAAIAADDAFHGVPVEVAANRALRDTLDQVTPLLRRMERMRFASLTGRTSVARHTRIVDLLRRGEADEAGREARANWLTLT